MSLDVYLTQEGLQSLEEELDSLLTQGRAEIADRIREARGFGDLSENAEYDSAKDDQAKMEKRIIQLEEKLRCAVVIEAVDSSLIQMGSRVTLRETKTKRESTYVLVGSTEARPSEGKLSNESPVGQALLGAKVGQTVSVASPRGVNRLKVIKIEAS
jgi:transcription elongation factor GreA